MKLIAMLLFFTISALSSADIAEYKLFIQGKENLESENYAQARDSFSKIINTYPNSNLIKTTRPYFYLGKSYYYLGKYSDAVTQLLRSNYEQYETNYLLGSSYLELNQNDMAQDFFKKNYLDKYIYDNREFEQKSIEALRILNPNYNSIYEVRFNKNKNLLSNLNFSEIVKNGNYFYSKGDYKFALKLYEMALKKQASYTIETEIIKTLYLDKQYERAIELGEIFLKTNIYKSQLCYYIGNSYRRQNRLPEAIDYLKKVKTDSLQKTRNSIIGRLYYLMGEYDPAIVYLKSADTLDSVSYLLKLYEKTGNVKEYHNTLEYLYKVNPYSDLAGEYRYKTYLETTEQSIVDDIIRYNYNSIYYALIHKETGRVRELQEYNIEEKLNKYKSLTQKIDALAEIKYFEGVIIELDYTDFPRDDRLIEAYLLTQAYSNAGEYFKALRTSYKNNYHFSIYSDFVEFLYPKYFSEYVQKYSQIYGVDSDLVYSVIKQESNFNPEIISYASAYGLMQLILTTAQMFEPNITPDKLLEPEKNIEIGVRYLSYLQNKFDGDLNATISGYNGGPGNAQKWLNRFGEINFDNIPFEQTRNYLRKVSNNYFRYKTLYR